MNLSLFVLTVILLVAATGLGFAVVLLRDEVASLRRRRAEEAQRLRQQLQAVRVHLAREFPEVASLCNSLERGLQCREGVDLNGLEVHLRRLRRAHELQLLGGEQLPAGLKKPLEVWQSYTAGGGK